MIKHIVCWKIKEGLNKEVCGPEIKNRLLGLKDQIKQLKHIEVGINSEDSSKGNYDVVLVSEFNSIKDLEAYTGHPAHIKAGTYVKSVTAERVAVDYEFE